MKSTSSRGITAIIAFSVFDDEIPRYTLPYFHPLVPLPSPSDLVRVSCLSEDWSLEPAAMELLAQSSPGPVKADDEQPDFGQVYDQLRQAIGRAMMRQLLRQFIALYSDLLR